MAGSRAKVLSAVFPALLTGVGMPALATSPAVNVRSPGRLVATGADGDEYPRVRDQQHHGRRCTADSTVVAAGTIVVVGGQVAAAGGGSGTDCDTFYAYEYRGGPPTVRQPYLEPGVYLRPGGALRTESAWV